MKMIKVPTNVLIATTSGSQEVSFADFVCNNLLMDNKFGADYKTLKISSRLESSVQKVSPGQFWSIDDDWHALLMEVINNPSQGYAPGPARKLLPFFEAITEAFTETVADAN